MRISNLNSCLQYFIKFSLTFSSITVQFATIHFWKSLLVVFLWVFVTYWMEHHWQFYWKLASIVEIFVSNVWTRFESRIKIKENQVSKKKRLCTTSYGKLNWYIISQLVLLVKISEQINKLRVLWYKSNMKYLSGCTW